jgi:hypothetical protein
VTDEGIVTEAVVDSTAKKADENGRTSRARRWFAGPPARIFSVVLGLTVALTLLSVAAPGTYFQPLMAATLLWLGLGLAYLLKLGLAVVFALVQADGAGLRRYWPRWLAVPVIVGATAALVLAAAPVRLGLLLAAPAMTEFAQDASAPAPGWVGPYALDQAEHLPGGGARFLIAGTGFLDPSGFAYSPDGPPPVLGEDSYQHLSGPWYQWTESW